MLTTDRIGGSALCLLALFVMWESRTHAHRLAEGVRKVGRVEQK